MKTTDTKKLAKSIRALRERYAEAVSELLFDIMEDINVTIFDPGGERYSSYTVSEILSSGRCIEIQMTLDDHYLVAQSVPAPLFSQSRKSKHKKAKI